MKCEVCGKTGDIPLTALLVKVGGKRYGPACVDCFKRLLGREVATFGKPIPEQIPLASGRPSKCPGNPVELRL